MRAIIKIKDIEVKFEVPDIESPAVGIPPASQQECQTYFMQKVKRIAIDCYREAHSSQKPSTR